MHLKNICTGKHVSRSAASAEELEKGGQSQPKKSAAQRKPMTPSRPPRSAPDSRVKTGADLQVAFTAAANRQSGPPKDPAEPSQAAAGKRMPFLPPVLFQESAARAAAGPQAAGLKAADAFAHAAGAGPSESASKAAAGAQASAADLQLCCETALEGMEVPLHERRPASGPSLPGPARTMFGGLQLRAELPTQETGAASDEVNVSTSQSPLGGLG